MVQCFQNKDANNVSPLFVSLPVLKQWNFSDAKDGLLQRGLDPNIILSLCTRQ